MADKQIFATDSVRRWRRFQWASRFVLFIVILMIPVAILTLYQGISTPLPALQTGDSIAHPLLHPALPPLFSAKELKKYKGFNDFLQARYKNSQLAARRRMGSGLVRAAFYVDWDPQAFFSLQKNIDQLNMVLPEWMFLDPDTDTLQVKVDSSALAVMRSAKIRVLPMVSNVNDALGEGTFDGNMLHRLLHNPAKKERFINDLLNAMERYHFQGINIDFEELKEQSDEPLIAFQHELFQKFHAKGLLVTQDVMAGNSDFNYKRLSACNDYMVLMAYDEHFSTSTPGAVGSQQWIEKMLDEAAADIPSNKIILGVAGYGYDWSDGAEATTVTYQQALANAAQYKATIHFDNHTYSSNYRYSDGDGRQHQVFFNDAAGNFNTLRFADEYGVAGTALWRLGSEDERLWKFYSRNLGNDSLQAHPFSMARLEKVQTPVQTPDYIGDGEVLNVITAPQPGLLHIEVDSTEQLIAEEQYLQLPTRYVIRKYGNVNNQVILSFDDGPDAEYTPEILDILRKEKVPAVFFVVGLQAEKNLPLLKRIYQEGHEIGNHTFTHPNIAAIGTERAINEMETTRLLIEAVTGHSTVLFRAPYNADSEPTSEVELKPIAISRQKNYYTVGESIDPNDWETGVTADSVYKRVVDQYEANPAKGIILLHDAGGNREATVQALPRIIAYFKSRHVQFTTLANLLHTDKAAIMPPAPKQWVPLNIGLIRFWYWTQLFLTGAFWTAIVLGLARILLLGIMALIQRSRKKAPAALPDSLPLVSILVPAYNEALNAVNTVRTLLQQDYPNLEIVFVDDGSADDTYARVHTAFGHDPRVQVLTKPNGGKASALNLGITESRGDYLVCIDADTQLRHDAVRQLITCFFRPAEKPIGAVAGNVKVGNERNLITRWQSIEYTTAQNFDRRAFDLVNGITVVPGAIGAFQKQAVLNAGCFTTDTLAEDCDLTIRLLRNGYRIVNCNEAVAVTEAPETLSQFLRQRFRWSYGIMQAFWKNKDACFNPRYGALGMLALPNIFLFQLLLPLLAPLADLMLVVSLVWNRHDPQSMHKIALFYGLFLLVDVFVSVLAFSFEKEKMYKLVWLIPQRFVYRQLMYYTLFRSLRKAIKGEGQGWGVLTRTGNVKGVALPHL